MPETLGPGPSRRRTRCLALLLTALVAACSGDRLGSPDAATPAASVPAEPAAVDRSSASTGDTADEAARASAPEAAAPAGDAVSADDLTLFIAAAERALAGTAQQDAVFDDPDIYIAIAQASCARFSDGDEFDQIAADVLVDTSTGSADETRLVGAVIGAATQTICPEHADAI